MELGWEEMRETGKSGEKLHAHGPETSPFPSKKIHLLRQPPSHILPKLQKLFSFRRAEQPTPARVHYSAGLRPFPVWPGQLKKTKKKERSTEEDSTVVSSLS